MRCGRLRTGRLRTGRLRTGRRCGVRRRGDAGWPGQTIQRLVRIGTATVDYPVTMRRDAMALVARR
ncbi:hypothetical protein AS850_02265 [Frondihabitans sp. 762G35]|nr:hypothetical protein AS850_02265 [Frondihabitans sp. 762G35]